MRVMFVSFTPVFCSIFLSTLQVDAAEPKSPDKLLGQSMAELFQVGFARGQQAMQDTQKIYDTLHRAAPQDPRIDYAHGLVLLRLLRNKEAKAEFLGAAKQPGTPYSPGWRALIWSYFVAKEYDDGYDHLFDFMKVIHSSEGLDKDTRHDDVYWIGRVMAALELTLDSNQGRESWLHAEEKLKGLMAEDSIEAYNGGKSVVHARHAMLEEEIRQVRDKEKERLAELQGKKLEQIGRSLDAAKEKADDLKKSAAQLKEEFEEQTTAFQNQMAQAEKDYAFLERKGLTLLTSILAFDQQINLGRNLNSNAGSSQRNAALQNQQYLFNTDFQMTLVAAQQISTKAQQLARARAAYVDQYQKATGEIVKEDLGVEKWKERALKQAAEIKKAEKKPKAPPTMVASKIQAATTFRTYVDLDVFAERDKVLSSFGIAADVK